MAQLQDELRAMGEELLGQKEEIERLRISQGLGTSALEKCNDEMKLSAAAMEEHRRGAKEAEAELREQIKELKEELSAAKAKESGKIGGDLEKGEINQGVPTTQADIDSLGRLIISSGPFTKTITHLLRLTVGHTLSLSVGCFTIENPDRVLQVAEACDVQHSLAALGVLHDLPLWAGEREQTFRRLVMEALEGGCQDEPSSKALDLIMLAFLGKKDGMQAVSSAEEQQAAKSFLAEILQSISGQHKLALDELAEHRGITTDAITAAGATAVRSVQSRAQTELSAIHVKLDRLDKVALTLEQLASAPNGTLSGNDNSHAYPSDFTPSVITRALQAPRIPNRITATHTGPTNVFPSSTNYVLETAAALANRAASPGPILPTSGGRAAGPRWSSGDGVTPRTRM